MKSDFYIVGLCVMLDVLKIAVGVMHYRKVKLDSLTITGARMASSPAGGRESLSPAGSVRVGTAGTPKARQRSLRGTPTPATGRHSTPTRSIPSI